MNAIDERTALERAVRAEPEDDTVRLVFADFLQDTEPERAELIRTQIWLHRSWESNRHTRVENRRRSAKVKKMLQFVDAAPKWCPFLPLQSNQIGYYDQLERGDLPVTVTQQPPDFLQTATFRRGFIEAVSLSMSVFMDAAGPLFRAHPVNSVYVTDREPARLLPEQTRTFIWVEESDWSAESTRVSRSRSVLPGEIYRLLSAGRERVYAGRRREYAPINGFVEEVATEVRMRATKDLYQACLTYGRSLAPLTTDQP